MFSELEKTIGYKFKKIDLLKEALTHPSMSFNQKKKYNYERLEFFGDTILSFVIAEYLFFNFKDKTEGELSKIKHILVSKDILYEVAKKINLGNFLILTKGEEHCGGRTNINNLENTMEALLAAIYIDSSFDIVKSIILNLWKDFFCINLEKSSKMELQEWTQKHLKILPSYTVEKMEIINKLETYTVKLSISGFSDIYGVGHNVKEVEKSLAKEMLDFIENNYANK